MKIYKKIKIELIKEYLENSNIFKIRWLMKNLKESFQFSITYKGIQFKNYIKRLFKKIYQLKNENKRLNKILNQFKKINNQMKNCQNCEIYDDCIYELTCKYGPYKGYDGIADDYWKLQEIFKT